MRVSIAEMLDLQRRLLNRKWAALLAVGFCGYLTVATSEMPSTRLPELGTSLERTFTLGSQSSEWKLTAVSTIEITSWHIQVTPAVLLTYVPPAGAKVRVVFDPDAETPTDAGVDTDACVICAWFALINVSDSIGAVHRDLWTAVYGVIHEGLKHLGGHWNPVAEHTVDAADLWTLPAALIGLRVGRDWLFERGAVLQ